MTNDEGGADPAEYLAKYIVDRVNTTATVWLGTTALWVAAILTLWSMFHYLRLAAPHIPPGDS